MRMYKYCLRGSERSDDIVCQHLIFVENVKKQQQARCKAKEHKLIRTASSHWRISSPNWCPLDSED